MRRRCCFPLLWTLAILVTAAALPAEELWRKHVVHEGLHTNTAIAGDFSVDGKPDVITSSGGHSRFISDLHLLVWHRPIAGPPHQTRSILI